MPTIAPFRASVAWFTGLKRITDPATEPVTLAEAKSFMRVTTSDDDALITSLIAVARNKAEEITERAFITQTWRMTMDHFPFGGREIWFDGVRELPISELRRALDFIKIPRPPEISVGKLATFSPDNTETTFDSSNYFLDLNSEPGRIVLNDGAVWPSDLRDWEAVLIEYDAGYGGASSVPEDIKHAIKIMVASLYENRGECADTASLEVPKSAKSLLQPYQIMRLG